METVSCSNSALLFSLPDPLTLKTDESLLSSDLSIELSHHEEQLPSLYLQGDEESEEEEEDEDLPSFTMTVDKSGTELFLQIAPIK